MSRSTDVTNSLMQKITDFSRIYFLPQQFGRHTLNPQTLNPKPETLKSRINRNCMNFALNCIFISFEFSLNVWENPRPIPSLFKIALPCQHQGPPSPNAHPALQVFQHHPTPARGPARLANPAQQVPAPAPTPASPTPVQPTPKIKL